MQEPPSGSYVCTDAIRGGGPTPTSCSSGSTTAQRARGHRPDELPLCIVAGAGSGKTRVLTRRIAWRVRDRPATIRAASSPSPSPGSAATELTARLRRPRPPRRRPCRHVPRHRLGRAAATAGRTAVGRAPTLRRPPDTGPGAGRRGRSAGSSPTSPPSSPGPGPDWSLPRTTPRRRPGRAPSARPCRAPAVAIAAATRAEKRRRGVVDFDDLLEQLADAIEDDPEFAAAQRWRFEHLYVDEFQDLNPLQERLLEAWRDRRPALCCVGDPNQAIYGVERRRPVAPRALRRALSGGAAVVAVAPQLPLDAAGARRSPTGSSTPASSAVSACEAVRAEGPAPGGAPATPTATRRRWASPGPCVDGRLPGSPWSHQAVLARTNAPARAGGVRPRGGRRAGAA